MKTITMILRAFVLSSIGVLLTLNSYAQDWEIIPTPSSYNNALMTFSLTGRGFISSNSQIIRSDDQGASWRIFFQDSHDELFKALKVISDTNIQSATQRKIYSAPINSVGVDTISRYLLLPEGRLRDSVPLRKFIGVSNDGKILIVRQEKDDRVGINRYEVLVSSDGGISFSFPTALNKYFSDRRVVLHTFEFAEMADTKLFFSMQSYSDIEYIMNQHGYWYLASLDKAIGGVPFIATNPSTLVGAARVFKSLNDSTIICSEFSPRYLVDSVWYVGGMQQVRHNFTTVGTWSYTQRANPRFDESYYYSSMLFNFPFSRMSFSPDGKCGSAIIHSEYSLDSNKKFLLRTTDGGASWGVQTINAPQKLNDVSVLDSLTTIVVGDSGLIMRTTNGGGQITPLPKIITDVPEPIATDATQRVYPNPAGDVLHVRSGEACNVVVFDVLGCQKYAGWQSGEGTIDISSYSGGSYTVVMRTAGGSVRVQQIVVIR